LNVESQPEMPAKNSKVESGGFSAEELAALKERAAELRDEGEKGAKKADGLQAILDRIAGGGAEASCARRIRPCGGDRYRPGAVAKTW